MLFSHANHGSDSSYVLMSGGLNSAVQICRQLSSGSASCSIICDRHANGRRRRTLLGEEESGEEGRRLSERRWWRRPVVPLVPPASLSACPSPDLGISSPTVKTRACVPIENARHAGNRASSTFVKSILRDETQHLREKRHARGSDIVKGTRMAAHAHPRARGQGVQVPFRWWHKPHGSREVSDRAQQPARTAASSTREARI